TNVQFADMGNYSVTVSNQYGVAISSNAFLAMAGAVLITSQPQSQTVPAGANAFFSVGAAGNAPLGYQWRFNGINIAGATKTFLAITSVQSSNKGAYSVAVSNSLGVVMSSDAILLLAQLLGWGDNTFGQLAMPFGLTNLTAIAAGQWHSLALRSDGSLAAWG